MKQILPNPNFAIRQSTGRIMIVDDASLVRMFYGEALRGAGYDVDEALNGLEALEKLLIAPAGLIVLDVNMPRMDGMTFLRALRRSEQPAAGRDAGAGHQHRGGAAGRRTGARGGSQFLPRQAGFPGRAD